MWLFRLKTEAVPLKAHKTDDVTKNQNLLIHTPRVHTVKVFTARSVVSGWQTSGQLLASAWQPLPDSPNWDEIEANWWIFMVWTWTSVTLVQSVMTSACSSLQEELGNRFNVYKKPLSLRVLLQLEAGDVHTCRASCTSALPSSVWSTGPVWRSVSARLVCLGIWSSGWGPADTFREI